MSLEETPVSPEEEDVREPGRGGRRPPSSCASVGSRRFASKRLPVTPAPQDGFKATVTRCGDLHRAAGCRVCCAVAQPHRLLLHHAMFYRGRTRHTVSRPGGPFRTLPRSGSEASPGHFAHGIPRGQNRRENMRCEEIHARRSMAEDVSAFRCFVLSPVAGAVGCTLLLEE